MIQEVFLPQISQNSADLDLTNFRNLSNRQAKFICENQRNLRETNKN